MSILLLIILAFARVRRKTLRFHVSIGAQRNNYFLINRTITYVLVEWITDKMKKTIAIIIQITFIITQIMEE